MLNIIQKQGLEYVALLHTEYAAVNELERLQEEENILNNHLENFKSQLLVAEELSGEPVFNVHHLKEVREILQKMSDTRINKRQAELRLQKIRDRMGWIEGGFQTADD